MDEIIEQISAWHAAGEQVAVATVIRVTGSTPRSVGARLATAVGGRFVGSVSGGCVEGAVIEEASRVLEEGRPRRVCYGISDELGWAVGLACGGAIEVLVQVAKPPIWEELAEATSRGEPCVLLTMVDGDRMGDQAVVTCGQSAGDSPWGDATRVAERVLAGRTAEPQVVDEAVLVEPFFPRPHLVIVGGVHAAIPLTRMARMLGFRVTVADPRGRFANRERFPEAERVVVAWPTEAMAELDVDGRSAVVILTHDPKIDEPAIQSALASEAFYIGVIGSRSTQVARRERLAASGVPAEQLKRIHGPIGLDVGGRLPEEMALAILAEIVAVRHGRSGGTLTQLAGG